jgi:hypothetical protein
VPLEYRNTTEAELIPEHHPKQHCDMVFDLVTAIETDLGRQVKVCSLLYIHICQIHICMYIDMLVLMEDK